MELLLVIRWMIWWSSLAIVLESSTCISHNFSAIFIFGDSLADVGNNNYIRTIAKANFKPIGIDFGKPTGRFTNGRTVDDILGQWLGFKDFTPPYLAPTTVGSVVLRGVNYASGASGILKASGANYVGRIAMDEQLDNFKQTRVDIISRIGAPGAHELFATALFEVSTGSNDFINNYLLTDVSESPESPETFIGILISAFRRQLTRLYDMGGRKIVVANIPPIGCCPYVRDHLKYPSSGEGCVAFPNLLARKYNHQLKQTLVELTSSLEGSTFVYADVYRILDDIIHNYTSYGFKFADRGCCSILGRHGGLVPCLPFTRVCPDRSKYIFWDCFHSTEAANMIIAKRFLDGDSMDISPINIRELSET
ncbi:GDSL esterase/lipase At4g16230-like [Cynara cardunculus var. scolymus]|uniref:GDSL esterase/lipase At4g16230-like n=1 Tax=Cynara cardunculus var. scolymus TaxID=59895 RepID=UPI000D624987|nr:GDSL esterase/lipase At4g16230-like [Cynara cardunculus var. scolymus]